MCVFLVCCHPWLLKVSKKKKKNTTKDFTSLWFSKTLHSSVISKLERSSLLYEINCLRTKAEQDSAVFWRQEEWNRCPHAIRSDDHDWGLATLLSQGLFIFSLFFLCFFKVGGMNCTVQCTHTHWHFKIYVRYRSGWQT